MWKTALKKVTWSILEYFDTFLIAKKLSKRQVLRKALLFLKKMTYKEMRYPYYFAISNIGVFNPLSANPLKWSNKLKQFVGNS